MKINIFILNWNSAKTIKECLNRILASDDKNFRVILINNFSTNLDLIELRNIYDTFINNIEIYLIENDANMGYAGGNNKGFRFLTINNLSGNILILNPDILISENTISEMKKVLVENVGIVTVRTLDTQGKILFDAIKLKGFFQKNIITDKQIIDTDYSQGSCMLIKREIINEIGLFDGRFFLYWEEVDFSLRVKKMGKKLISITSTFVIRKENEISSFPLAFYYSVRNAKLIKSIHKNEFSTTSYYLYLIKMLLLSFKFIIKPPIFRDIIINYYVGLIDSFKGRYFSK